MGLAIRYSGRPEPRIGTVQSVGSSNQVLAMAAGIKLKTIKDFNPELRQSATPADGVYTIKLPLGTKNRFLNEFNALPEDQRFSPQYVFHRVKKGESLWTISRKYGFKFSGNEILFLQHPVTTQIESTKNQITNSLKAIQMINQPTITIAPNSDAGNNVIFKHLAAFSKSHTSFMLFKSLPRSDYLGMLKNCKVLVGNSSSGIIEASYFKIPVVNIGIRQKNREKGSNVLNAEDNSVVSIQNQLIKIYNKTSKLQDVMALYDPPCDEMNVVTNVILRPYGSDHKKGNPIFDAIFSKNKLFLKFKYQDRTYQEVTNSRDFGFESFWSSVGGFVGIFLGYSMSQIPEILLLCLRKAI